MQEKLKMHRCGASFLEEIIERELRDNLYDIKKGIQKIEKILGVKGRGFERVAIGEEYCTICTVPANGNIIVATKKEVGDSFDDGCFKLGNYFFSEKNTEKAIDKICFMLMMEKYHSAYCPDYYPDETKEKLFHTVFYDKEIESYVPVTLTVLNGALTYFETKEIAKTVCEILNEKGKLI